MAVLAVTVVIPVNAAKKTNKKQIQVLNLYQDQKTDIEEAEYLVSYLEDKNIDEESVEKQEKAEVTILQVSSLGGFSVYHLQTEKGVVHVKRCYYGYKDGIMKSEDEGEYQTDYWRYTDDGYLMFSGTYFSEELYVLTLSSAEEHVAFRILPLDAKCRELNEKYLLPIGYELNNMFLVRMILEN